MKSMPDNKQTIRIKHLEFQILDMMELGLFMIIHRRNDTWTLLIVNLSNYRNFVKMLISIIFAGKISLLLNKLGSLVVCAVHWFWQKLVNYFYLLTIYTASRSTMH